MWLVIVPFLEVDLPSFWVIFILPPRRFNVIGRRRWIKWIVNDFPVSFLRINFGSFLTLRSGLVGILSSTYPHSCYLWCLHYSITSVLNALWDYSPVLPLSECKGYQFCLHFVVFCADMVFKVQMVNVILILVLITLIVHIYSHLYLQISGGE